MGMEGARGVRATRPGRAQIRRLVERGRLRLTCWQWVPAAVWRRVSRGAGRSRASGPALTPMLRGPSSGNTASSRLASSQSWAAAGCSTPVSSVEWHPLAVAAGGLHEASQNAASGPVQVRTITMSNAAARITVSRRHTLQVSYLRSRSLDAPGRPPCQIASSRPVNYSQRLAKFSAQPTVDSPCEETQARHGRDQDWRTGIARSMSWRRYKHVPPLSSHT